MDATIGVIDTRRGVRRSTALARVITFSQKFGEVYLNLACHAAFPLVLTPDLLYRIWSIFVPQAPWTSISDILLSGLCREVGYELYEMDLTVRELLLQELKQNEDLGSERLNDLADFLMEYVARQLKSSDLEEVHLAEAQRWTALAYTRPSTAAREIAMALSRLRSEDQEELFRLSSLVETFATSLNEFGLLLSYTRSMTRLVYGDIKGAVEQIEKLPRHKNHVLVAGISLSIPEKIMSQIENESEGDFSSISTSESTGNSSIFEEMNDPISDPTNSITEIPLGISKEPIAPIEMTPKAGRRSIWSGVRIPNVLDRLFGKDQKSEERRSLGCEFSIADVVEQRFEIEKANYDSTIVNYIAYDRYDREHIVIITYHNTVIWEHKLIDHFRAEATKWAQLDEHRNIVNVRRIRTLAGKLYIFAEYISEKTLRAYVANLSYREVIEFAVQICWAMIYANKQGVTVHGDLRPENIMITPEGQLKVGGFGVGSALLIQPWLDKVNSSIDNSSIFPEVDILGNRLPYLAPELLKGASYNDNRVDIYSFGVILYELFTGRLPYDSFINETNDSVGSNNSPTDLRILKPDIHSMAISIVLNCLAIKRNDRYQSFQDIEGDLQSLYVQLFGVRYVSPWPDAFGVDSTRLHERGLIYMDLSRYKEALQHFRRAINIQKDYPGGWVNLAHAHIKLYDYNEAIRVVEEGLRYAKGRSDFAQLYQAYGEAFAAIMMLDKALEAFDQALSYMPNAPMILREKGRVLQRVGRSREAQQCFEHAIRYDKFDSYSWMLLGNIHLEKRNFKQAYHAYGEALKLEPQSAFAWSRYGACQLGLSRPREALRSYEMALKIDPDLEEASEALRRLRMS
jgi:eukaryotic-like serine/threonine-protein kinase